MKALDIFSRVAVDSDNSLTAAREQRPDLSSRNQLIPIIARTPLDPNPSVRVDKEVNIFCIRSHFHLLEVVSWFSVKWSFDRWALAS